MRVAILLALNCGVLWADAMMALSAHIGGAVPRTVMFAVLGWACTYCLVFALGELVAAVGLFWVILMFLSTESFLFLNNGFLELTLFTVVPLFVAIATTMVLMRRYDEPALGGDTDEKEAAETAKEMEDKIAAAQAAEETEIAAGIAAKENEAQIAQVEANFAAKQAKARLAEEKRQKHFSFK